MGRQNPKAYQGAEEEEEDSEEAQHEAMLANSSQQQRPDLLERQTKSALSGSYNVIKNSKKAKR